MNLKEKSYVTLAPQACDGIWSVVVPPDHLWVLGDNRENSADSRAHIGDPGGGFIPVDDVVGKVFVTVWPPDRWRFFHRPSTFDNPALNAGLGVVGTRHPARAPSWSSCRCCTGAPTGRGWLSSTSRLPALSLVSLVSRIRAPRTGTGCDGEPHRCRPTRSLRPSDRPTGHRPTDLPRCSRARHHRGHRPGGLGAAAGLRRPGLLRADRLDAAGDPAARQDPGEPGGRHPSRRGRGLQGPRRLDPGEREVRSARADPVGARVRRCASAVQRQPPGEAGDRAARRPRRVLLNTAAG